MRLRKLSFEERGEALEEHCDLHKVAALLKASPVNSNELQRILGKYQFWQQLFAEMGGCVPALVECLRVKAVRGGQMLFQRGDTHNVFYFVLRGGAVAMIRMRGADPDPSERKARDPKSSDLSQSRMGQSRLAESKAESVEPLMSGHIPGCYFREGSFFGQAQLIRGERKSCTVVTTQDSWFLTISKEDYDSGIGVKLQAIKCSWKERLVRSLRIFGAWENDIDALLFLCLEKQLPRGHLVFSEGQMFDCLYIIRSGEIQLSCQTPKGKFGYMRISAPSFFGEEEIFQNHNNRARLSTATVVSAKAELLLISRKKLSMVFERPDCPAKIKNISQQRKQLKQQLLANLVKPAAQQSEPAFPQAILSPAKKRDRSSVEFSMLMSDSKQYNETRKKYRARLGSLSSKKAERQVGSGNNCLLTLARRVLMQSEERVPRELTTSNDLMVYNWHHRVTHDLQWSGACRPRTSSYNFQQKKRYFKYIEACLADSPVPSPTTSRTVA